MPLLYIGPICSVIGITLITFLSSDSKLYLQIIYLFITGIGAGGVITVRVIAAQAAVPKHLIAVATAVVQFSMLLGGMIGIAVTGTIFNNALLRNVRSSVDLQLFLNSTDANINLIQLRQTLPTTSLVSSLVTAFLEAFRLSYRSILPYPIGMLVLAVVFVRQR
ncbi:hypothetical protein HDU67_010151 [Dinochytrium kinnereticum]|nr:hypothetical protein HDU67_010151 [Dinochytrium kinnereticum]